MQVGTTQSQSTQSQSTLIASLSVTTQIQAQKVSTQEGGPGAAVLLSVSRTVDFSYAQQVLRTEVGTQLETALKDAGIDLDLQSLLDGAVDLSPEATAKRIVDFATSFFGGFQAGHTDLKGGRQVQDFTQLIRDAVDEGFQQSRDLLEGIAQMSAETQADIDETHRLVMQGIDDFAKDQLQVISAVRPADVEAPAPPQPLETLRQSPASPTDLLAV